MDKLLPYSHQSIDETDIDAVVEVLRSDFLTQGSRVAEFEQSLIDLPLHFLLGQQHYMVPALQLGSSMGMS